MATSAGFEPATYGLEVRCSIQLSYEALIGKTFSVGPVGGAAELEVVGIGLSWPPRLVLFHYIIGNAFAFGIGNSFFF